MKFDRKYFPRHQFVKKGKDYVRVKEVVNKWNGEPPIEEDIKKPTD